MGVRNGSYIAELVDVANPVGLRYGVSFFFKKNFLIPESSEG